jgi:hypothetical protein
LVPVAFPAIVSNLSQEEGGALPQRFAFRSCIPRIGRT